MMHRVQHSDVMDTLPAILQRGLMLDRCSAKDIADMYAINERTLYRRLNSAGTSFRHELDRMRESLSVQLLESTNLPICDIATSLGYAGSSGFIRAFHRWTGSSPAHWRKHNTLHRGSARPNSPGAQARKRSTAIPDGSAPPGA